MLDAAHKAGDSLFDVCNRRIGSEMAARSLQAHRIIIDGKWSLEDLADFPHVYDQVYFALEAMSALGQSEVDERIVQAFSAYPWHGGYSAVGFFNELKWATPKRERPQLKSMHYASLGGMELLLDVVVAERIVALVIRITKAFDAINGTYQDVVRGLIERKLLSLKAKETELTLAKHELDFIDYCATRMAKVLGFTNLNALNRTTGSAYKSLKIIMAVYRRLRRLVAFQRDGKVDFVATQSQPRLSAPKKARTPKEKQTIKG